MREDWPVMLDSFLKSYCVISRLGFGSFGCAVLAKYRNDVGELLLPDFRKRGTLLEPSSNSAPFSDGLVAIKIMKTPLRHPSDSLKVNEIKFILAMPSHHNLLQIFRLFIDSSSAKLNIVMEPMNQNLYHFIQKHEERELSNVVVKSMLAQLLNAIRHIHKHGYFHRDVKPENILVSATSQYYGGVQNVPPERQKDQYMVKLCDYGLARHIGNRKPLTLYVSTRWYRAPEILLRQKRYSRPVDMWAFATVAAELVNSRPLFAGMNETEQIWKILTRLGHPMYEKLHDDMGGNWQEGVWLADELGFYMPYMASTSIYGIMPNPLHHMLAQTVKDCFSWDPKQRPTAVELSKRHYFEDSILQENYGDNSDFDATARLRRSDLLPGLRHEGSKANRAYEMYSDPIGGVSCPTKALKLTRSDDDYSHDLVSEYMRRYTTVETDGYNSDATVSEHGASPSLSRVSGVALEELKLQNTSFGSSREIPC